jgi:hypothetical protein
MTVSVVTREGDVRPGADQNVRQPERVGVDVPEWLHLVRGQAAAAVSFDHS